jgi:dihydroorotate dehydrogenase
LFELIFFTSNRVKTQHAKHLCGEFNIEIVNFNQVTKLANYEEPRIDDRDELLRASFENAKSNSKYPVMVKISPVNYCWNDKNRKQLSGYPING